VRGRGGGGLRSPLFAKRQFDVCIVDEASQVTLPVCLGPLRYASAFVLVGDHYQLPPLVRTQDRNTRVCGLAATKTGPRGGRRAGQVRNPEARDCGLDVSLFRQLCEAHPAATVTLQHQYRMNAELMALANTLTYGACVCLHIEAYACDPYAGGRLRCGYPALASKRLVLPGLAALAAHLHPPEARPGVGTISCTAASSTACWVLHAVDPMCVSCARIGRRGSVYGPD
jgi:DNA replication ATP-dependent helicase Dna2